MKVTLNIENDSELRLHIKDAIKGQVLSIVRDEFLQIVKDEIYKKIKGMNIDFFDRMLKESMIVAIIKLLREEHNVKEWNDSFIRVYINNYLEKIISQKDWNKVIDDLAKEKIKNLIV